MFARVIQGKAKEYVSIVRGYRDQNGKVKQQTVFSLGPVTPETKDQTLQIARNIISYNEGAAIIASAEDINETERKNWGAPAVINKLWNKFELDSVISKSKTINATKLMLINQFLAPKSKLRSWNERNKYDGFENLKLHDIYRTLDELDDNIDKIKSHILAKQKAFSYSVDVLFFDVTTLYFESQKSDQLKDFGFSKDCKFNEVQIVLSLVIDGDGRPLTYKIFTGNTYEGATLLPSLIELRKEMKIDKVIIVADRGMCSRANLASLRENGFDYIVGSRLRSSSKVVQEQALQDEGYEDLYKSDENIVSYKILDINLNKNKSRDFVGDEQDHWLCLWSSSRSEKDAKDRARLVGRAEEMLESRNLNDKRGAKKYITGQGSDYSNYELDELKIERDRRFDGYYSIAFSRKDLATPRAIVDAYHNLWKIEESFRSLKSFFEVRPMWHWTEKRISGHVLLNFISLVMHQDLELNLKKTGVNMSENKVRECLNNMEYSCLEIGQIILESYAKLDQDQLLILDKLGIKKPRNTMTKK